MSATLGQGGELERATGVKAIHRLPAPKGWEGRSPGRRLIVFPNLSLSDADTGSVVAEFIKNTDRALVLCPDRQRASEVENQLSTHGVEKQILHGEDIEEDVAAFTEQSAVLVLTNRYDGLDLPDESCRALVVAGLPTATNLQERFLTQRLGAEAVLRNRVRTRVTQAVGRCTRNDTDFAAVVLAGELLARKVVQSEFCAGLHQDLRAEVTLGIENSKDTDAPALVELGKTFLSDAEMRQQVLQFVINSRSEIEETPDPAAVILGNIVHKEVDYADAAWSGEWRRAFNCAKAVCDGLEGGESLRPYRALWYYFAGCAAKRAGDLENDSALLSSATDLLERAIQCGSGASWFAALRREVTPGVSVVEDLDQLAVESSTRQLMRLGTVGKRFDVRMGELQGQLSNTAPAQFHCGLEALGLLLGYEAERLKQEQAAPDVVWILDRRVYVAFEAKSDENPGKLISPSTVRQTKGHADWVRSKYGPPVEADVITVLATYQTDLDQASKHLAEGVSYVKITDLVSLADALVTLLRTVRTEASSSDEVHLRERLARDMSRANLLPSQLNTWLRLLRELDNH